MTTKDDRTPLETRLVATFAAHVDDTLVRDEAWATIVGEARQRDRFHPATRSVLAVLAAAAVLIVAVVVVGANHTEDNGRDGSIIVGTAPPGSSLERPNVHRSAAINQEVNVIARSGIDLAQALEKEQRLRQLRQFVPAAEVTDAQISAQAAETDRAAASWADRVARSALRDESASFNDAVKQAQNRIKDLGRVRQLPPTNVPAPLDASQGSMDDAFGSSVLDVRTVNRTLVQLSSSVPQARTLIVLGSFGYEASWRARASTNAIVAFAGGTASSDDVVNDIGSLLANARQAQADVDRTATADQLDARHAALDGALGDDVLSRLIDERVALTISLAGWTEMSDAVVGRYRALERQLAAGLPESPEPDTGSLAGPTRALVAADIDLAHNLTKELLLTARDSQASPPVVSDDLVQARGRTDDLVDTRRAAVAASGLVGDAGATARERRLAGIVDELPATRAVALGLDGARARTTIAQLTKELDGELEDIVWRAGSVPEAIDLVALAAFHEYVGTSALAASIAITEAARPAARLPSLVGAVSQAAEAGQRFDERATGEQKQAKRAADKAGLDAERLMRLVIEGTPVAPSDLITAATSWIAQLHEAEAAIARSPIRPWPDPRGETTTAMATTIPAPSTTTP